MSRASRGWFVDFAQDAPHRRLGTVKAARSPEVRAVVLARPWGVRVHVWALSPREAVKRAKQAVQACPRAWDARRLVCADCGAVVRFTEAGETEAPLPCQHRAPVVWEDQRGT